MEVLRFDGGLSSFYLAQRSSFYNTPHTPSILFFYIFLSVTARELDELFYETEKNENSQESIEPPTHHGLFRIFSESDNLAH